MAVGVVLGLAAPGFSRNLAPVSNIFLRLIRSIIAPLLFGTLVYGIAGTGSVKAMGRIGLKAVVYFEIVTTAALFLGLAAVNLARPGEGMTLERTAAEAALPAAPPSAASFLEHVFRLVIAPWPEVLIVVFSLL
jgi:proton glutamate symport protein